MSDPNRLFNKSGLVEKAYYRPKENSHPENRVLVSTPHFLKVHGPTRCFGQETVDMVQVDLVIRYEVLDCWDVVGTGPSQGRTRNLTFDQMKFYEKVPKDELPWHNGEKWYSDTMWARPEVQARLARMLPDD